MSCSALHVLSLLRHAAEARRYNTHGSESESAPSACAGPGLNPQRVHFCFGASVVEALIRILTEIERTSDVTTYLMQRVNENWPAKLC